MNKTDSQSSKSQDGPNGRTYISRHHRYALFGRSNGRCNICKEELILDKENDAPYSIGEIAHIRGANPGSARYTPKMNYEARNHYENLILVCGNCHSKIDNDEERYPPKRLENIKEQHEESVSISTRSAIPNVNFDELEVVIKFLAKKVTPVNDEGKIVLTPPKKKIAKNNLSPTVEGLIIQGLAKVDLVADYLNQNPDVEFSERLKIGFIDKYEELVDEKLSSDEIFYAMLHFATGNNKSAIARASGLTVLTYFFEKCDIFEA